MAEKKKRVALIAGGSGGIGAAVSVALAASGSLVYIGYNQGKEKAEKLAETINGENISAKAIHLDVTETGVVDSVCQQIFESEDSLNILVNCASINREFPAAGMDDETWREVLDVNLDGAFRLARACAKYMVLGRWGRIVNVSSISAVHGGRGQINYAAGKAGLESMTRVLAIELSRKGVLVNCIAPGVIETPLSERIRSEYGSELLANIAVRRFGTPEEAAGVISFLCSDAASYITGQVIRVDGGMCL